MCVVIIQRRYNVVVFGWFSQLTAETHLPDAPPSKSPFAALRWLHLAVARNFSSGMVVWTPTDGGQGAFYRQSPPHASASSTGRSACAYRRQKRQSPHGRSLSRPTRRGQGSTAGTSPRSRSCRRRTDRGTRRCRRRRTSTRIHPSSITQFCTAGRSRVHDPSSIIDRAQQSAQHDPRHAARWRECPRIHVHCQSTLSTCVVLESTAHSCCLVSVRSVSCTHRHNLLYTCTCTSTQTWGSLQCDISLGASLY